MILRIVKLTINPDKVEQFVRFFNEHKSEIAAAEGCLHLELYRDINRKGHIITYSMWQDKASLEQYRRSGLFGNIWPVAKKWFIAKPEAYSYILA